MTIEKIRMKKALDLRVEPWEPEDPLEKQGYIVGFSDPDINQSMNGDTIERAMSGFLEYVFQLLRDYLEKPDEFAPRLAAQCEKILEYFRWTWNPKTRSKR